VTSCVPGDPIVTFEGVDEPVERVADDAPDSFHAGRGQPLDE